MPRRKRATDSDDAENDFMLPPASSPAKDTTSRASKRAKVTASPNLMETIQQDVAKERKKTSKSCTSIFLLSCTQAALTRMPSLVCFISDRIPSPYRLRCTPRSPAPNLLVWSGSCTALQYSTSRVTSSTLRVSFVFYTTYLLSLFATFGVVQGVAFAAAVLSLSLAIIFRDENNFVPADEKHVLTCPSSAMPAALTSSQKSAVSEFVSVAQVDKSTAAKILKTHGWDVGAAINA